MGETGTNLTKSIPGHVIPNLCFLHPEGSAGHIVHSGASVTRVIDTPFFMLGWDQYEFYKKCIGTRYAERLFSHPVGSAGHVVHFGASEVRIVDTRFFKLR
jgi:hypothetical protein